MSKHKEGDVLVSDYHGAVGELKKVKGKFVVVTLQQVINYIPNLWVTYKEWLRK